MTDHRTPLVLVTGLHRRLCARVGTRFLDRPGTVVVHHDVSRLGEGVVLRSERERTGTGVVERSTAVELAHGCLSCTLRLDLLPLLRRLARRDDVSRVVLHLDPALETEHLCWAVGNVVLDEEPRGLPETAGDWVRVDGVLAVVEAASWLDDVTSGDDLGDRGLAATPDDERTLAQVALAQVASADAVVSMAGYNTVAETLSTDTPALLVPRTTPRTEQIIRARGLGETGAIDWVDPSEATSETIGQWLAEAVANPAIREKQRAAREELGLNGLDRVVDLAADLAWLTDKSVAPLPVTDANIVAGYSSNAGIAADADPAGVTRNAVTVPAHSFEAAGVNHAAV